MTTQPSLFDPPVPTSPPADAECTRGLVLAALAERPMTPDEIAACLSLDPLSVRPRCTELRKAGRVERTGERRATDLGSAAYVLRRKDAA